MADPRWDAPQTYDPGNGLGHARSIRTKHLYITSGFHIVLKYAEVNHITSQHNASIPPSLHRDSPLRSIRKTLRGRLTRRKAARTAGVSIRCLSDGNTRTVMEGGFLKMETTQNPWGSIIQN